MPMRPLPFATRFALVLVSFTWLGGSLYAFPFGRVPRRSEPPIEGLVLYVSPAGDDAWSGTLPDPDAEGTDGPLATMEGGRDRIRRMKADGEGLSEPVTVLLREGTYAVTGPIEFTPRDSGTAACPITYRAYAGEEAVISGGSVITGWERDDSRHNKTRCRGKLWRVRLPETKKGGGWRFNQLFVNGQRRPRARIPNKGAFLRSDGPISSGNSRGFYFKEGDMRKWERLREAIVVVYHSWETSIHHVRSVDMETSMVTFREPAPWAMGTWERQQRYYVENVFEGLDEPGEWYLNRDTGVLYYYPLRGEKMKRLRVVAPRVASTLVELKGDPSRNAFVEHLRFENLSFLHTNANLRRLRNPGQGEIYQPAQIMASGARHLRFTGCEIAHTGAHGIWLGSGCEDNRVQQCHIHDLGGGGVYIGGGWGRHDGTPTRRNLVDNNFIHDGSHLFHGAHGVWIGRSSYNTVTHNEISNFDYSGISCGWSWGFQPSSANHNILDYNYIHHLGNGDGLSDMGGIYTLGVSPGTTERFNHIHDVYSYAHVSHGSGIYPDEGSSEILIENNVVHRVRTCPLFQHYGKNNIVRNNILAFGGKGQLQRCREDKPCHYVAEGNIVYADIPRMLAGVWKNGDWKLGRNVYWSTAGEPTFAGMDFATWQAKGNDADSIVADPLFVNPEKGDFRLEPNSPALRLGFQPIDLDKTGLYGDKAWVDLPKRYPNRPRNEIPAPIEPPLIIHFDFEGEEPGSSPLEGKIVLGGKGSSLVVSAETAATGTQSLKFTDAPEQQYNWTPHLYYRKTYAEGRIRLSWDMLNSAAAPASFYVEIRQWDVNPYRVGPTVSVSPDGTLTASKQELGTIPLDEWVHVEIVMELGKNAPKSYRLTLSVPGREPLAVEVPYFQEAFERITWLGISSTSETDSAFFIDNLKLGTAAELKQPPKRRKRRARPAKRAPREPPNDQKLVGHWTFDKEDGYTAEDSSGYENIGEIWAERAKGAFGTAIYCEPAASQVLVSDDPSLHFGTADFTISLWICPTQLAIGSADARRRFMDKNHYPKTWWNLNLTPEGRPLLEMGDGNGVPSRTGATGAIPEKAWTHLVFVVDRRNRQTRFYFNGKLDSSATIPDAFTGSLDVEGRPLSIGSSWQPFIGLLDEVKIFRRALTGAEIEADYESEKTARGSTDFERMD